MPLAALFYISYSGGGGGCLLFALQACLHAFVTPLPYRQQVSLRGKFAFNCNALVHDQTL